MRCEQNKREYNYSKFTYCRKLIKITINADRRKWIKNIEEDLKFQPMKFWK